MRLAVDPRSGSVRLTLPRRTSLAEALRWAETKRGWVEAQLARLPAEVPIVPGLRFGVGDRKLTLDWQERYPRTPRVVGDVLQVGGPRDRLADRVLGWLRKSAKLVLKEETRTLAKQARAQLKGVGVGDTVSRWGSCSAGGNIRYSWRLILAPEFVRRATVAHEVAHLVHLNHGPDFHALQRELLGEDPARARNWLRANGAALHCFGRGLGGGNRSVGSSSSSSTGNASL